MLIQHAWGVRRFWRVVPWWLLVFPRWGQAFPRSLRCIGMQRSQQTLTSDVVEGEAIGAIGEQMRESLPQTDTGYDTTSPGASEEPATAAPEPQSAAPEDDPLKAMQDALKEQGKK